MKAMINGIKVDYALEGKAKAPVLVLVHGFPFSRAFWKGQVAALKRDFRVLTYDLRGLGKSQLGPAPQPLEAYVDDLIALLDKLKLERVALAGLSMGGYIALRAAQREPGRFWALALCDTRADADSDEGKLKRASGIKGIREKGVDVYVRAMLPNLFAAATLQSRPAAPKALLAIMKASKADGMCNALAAMAGRTDTTSALARFRMPVLVLGGDEDKLSPPDVAQAMVARIPGADWVLLQGAGHVSNLDAPEAFNRALGEFLRRTSVGVLG